MEAKNTAEMVTHIRAILEQNQNPEDLVGRDDIRTLSIEVMISNFLEEAVSMAVNSADESMFQNIDYAEFKATATGEVSAWIDSGSFAVPEDCQRILQIETNDWSGVVKDLIEKSSPIYRMCQNRYFKSIGVKDRPVAFKDFSSTSRKITIFPAAGESIKLAYIKKSTLNIPDENAENQNTTIDCDDLIYEGACFYCAYLVAMVQGWASANTYRQEAVESLNAVNADNVRVAAAKMAQASR